MIKRIFVLLIAMLGISQMNAQTVSLSILDHRNEVNPKVLPNFYALKVNK